MNSAFLADGTPLKVLAATSSERAAPTAPVSPTERLAATTAAPTAPTAPIASAALCALSAAAPLDPAQRVRRGLWLAAAGVAMFALTLPLTRLAGGTSAAPQLPPDLVAYGRAAVAGLLSLLWLVWHHARWPSRAQWPVLVVGAAGVVLGFPLGVGWAVREVPAAHAAVVTGVLPLATALVATLWLRERAGAAFWACASAGCALVLLYAWTQGGGAWSRGDLLLLAAVASAACGYVAGARLSASGMPPEQVICWMLVLALPVTLSLSARQLMTAGDGWQLKNIAWSAWAALAYLALVSMWLGFFAWYRGLALAGTLRASQLQLLQPFASMLAAVPLLGEGLDLPTVVCAMAVVVCVAAGQRLHRHGKGNAAHRGAIPLAVARGELPPAAPQAPGSHVGPATAAAAGSDHPSPSTRPTTTVPAQERHR